MDADKVVLVVCACGWSGSVVDCAARWVVDLSVWIGCLGGIAVQFSDLVFVVAAGICVIGIKTGWVI